MFLESKSNNPSNAIDCGSHAANPLNDNTLDGNAINTTATVANPQPRLGENWDAFTAVYTQTQIQENMLFPEAGKGAFRMTGNDSNEGLVLATYTTTAPSIMQGI